MYSQPNQNVTMIDDLPDLSDLESNGAQQQFQSHEGEIQDPKYSKYIRSRMNTAAPESGMAPYNPPPQSSLQPSYPPQQHYQQQEEIRRPSRDSPTCIEIADHVMSCPICSKFYKNDNSVYIIAIVVMAIITILLLKRVLDL